MNGEARAISLRELVGSLGIGGRTSVAGAENDIAVFHGVLPDAVSPFADRIRNLGFRHVTLDLASMPADPDGG